MFSFIDSVMFRNEIIAIAENSDVYRIYFENGQPCIQRIIPENSEPRYTKAQYLLAMRKID